MSSVSLDEIYYQKEYQMQSKSSMEWSLVMQWILDLYCITEALKEMYDDGSKYNRWYQQLFYIKLYGLFDVINDDSSIIWLNNEYYNRIVICVNDIYKCISDEEYLYIKYRRVSAAHPIQNKYEIYDGLGKCKTIKCERIIRGEKKHLSGLDISNAINEVLLSCSYDEKLIDINIFNKLSLPILQLRNDLLENFVSSLSFY